MLKIINLSKSFHRNTENEIHVFQNFSLDIEKQKCTAIIGGNGCGKSTLMNLICGRLKADSGQIFLDQRDITALPEKRRVEYISLVHQNPSMGVSPSLTILENMALADKKCDRFSLRKLIDKSKKETYVELLSELSLGLENKLETKVQFLSGGQRQALSLLMATMKRPKLLLLDEHTAALDPKTSRLIMEKTRQLLEKLSITTVMISHNMKDALNYSDRLIMLSSGNIILDEDSRSLSEDELKEHWFAA